MPTVRGRDGVKRMFAALPAQIEGKLLRGAARAGATVVADEIKLRTPSEAVRENVRIRSRVADGRVIVRIDVRPGWARALGVWLEYGTDGHFISVDDTQRAGMSVRRINTLQKAGSLVIAGQYVGKTVWHPGSRAIPSFRPALDTKESEAIAAAQSYITARVTPGGIVGSDDKDDPQS